MLKTVAAGLTALFVTASSLAYAQAPSTPASQQENARPSAADLNALTDARIGIVKAALQLTHHVIDIVPTILAPNHTTKDLDNDVDAVGYSDPQSHRRR